MVELILPFPPSVNTYWRNITVKGRARTLISKRGREYTAEVAAICCGLEPVGDARLVVSVHLFPPDRRRRDIDNHMKGLLDAITKAGLWDDDEQVDELHIYRREVEKGGKCRVLIQRK